MVFVKRGRLLPMTLLVLAVLSVSTMAVVCGSEDSEAAPITEWFSYGHHLEFRDRNYDATRYASIEWAYSKEPLSEFNPGMIIPSDPEDGYSATLDLDIREYPYWSVTPLFVREIATMTGGEIKTAEFVVNVNPIPEVSYVLFMYDDTNGYKYQAVTRSTSIAVGTDPLVELPVDPSRDGFTFGGWYSDSACTVPFDNMNPARFEQDTDIIVYPKWIPTGGSPGGDPSVETHFVTVQPVNGIYLEYTSMAVQKGTGFSFTASVMDGFKFDISEMKAVTSNGRVLQSTDNPDGSRTFTLGSVTEDTTVMLTGYSQYFRVITFFDNVTTVGFDEWVLQGTSLTLPLASMVGGDIVATVFMGTSDVTGNTYSDGTIRILSVSGDVTIYANSVERPSSSDGGIDMWMYVAIAAIIIALVLVIVLIRRYRSG